MARHDMVWERLPGKWSEAPHFGNATLGSMLFRRGDALTLQVFRAGVCDHRDNSHGWTAYSRTRFTIGAFQLKPVGKIKVGAWRKNLWNAELAGVVETDCGTIRLRHFVHADEMAIVTEIWTSPGEAACQWTWQPHKAETTRPGYPRQAEEVEAFAKKYGDLLMIYPLYLVNSDQPDKREVLRQSVERFAATKGLPAMVATHSVPAAAAIGNGELALNGLRKLAADLYPNGMWFGSPCLESSLSAANGIQTMLLQSWGDKIRVFPAMPTAWRDAVFHNLRAEGAFLVSARRVAGQTQWVRIESLAGEPCRVKPNFAGEPRVVAGATNVALQSIGDGVYELGLAKGQTVVLAADGQGPFIVDALPAEAGRLNSFGLRAAEQTLSQP